MCSTKRKGVGLIASFSDLKELVSLHSSLPRVTKPVKGFKMSIFKPMYEPHNSLWPEIWPESGQISILSGVVICAVYTGQARADYLLSGNRKVR